MNIEYRTIKINNVDSNSYTTGNIITYQTKTSYDLHSVERHSIEIPFKSFILSGACIGRTIGLTLIPAFLASLLTMGICELDSVPHLLRFFIIPLSVIIPLLTCWAISYAMTKTRNEERFIAEQCERDGNKGKREYILEYQWRWFLSRLQ